MRTLDTSCPLVVGSAGVGDTPGPSQWKSGVPVTPVGRVTEQLRVTVSPAMTEEEGEEVREMKTVEIEAAVIWHMELTTCDIPVIFTAAVTVLGSVLEVATMVME